MTHTTDPELTIGSEPGVVVRVLPYGATLRAMEVTGGDGVRRDVLVGAADQAGLAASTDYLGGTIGRHANRIAQGRLTIDGRDVRLDPNDRGNHLHGGSDGFDRRTWSVLAHDATSLELELVSPDGDQGYPGEVRARARFSVEGDRVSLELTATTDAPTVVNLTTHAYLNLEGGGTVDEHELEVAAAHYLPVDDHGIPLGPVAPVDDTPFDLRSPQRLGAAARTDHEQVRRVGGLDHNLCLDGDGSLRRAARLSSPRTASSVEVWTDQPGLQVYTGNFLDGSTRSRSGALLRQGDGVALEPQRWPDGPNHADFPDAVLRPGETYRSTIEWRFGPLRPLTE